MTLRGIRKRGGSWHVDVSRNGVRLTATATSQKEAVAKRAELLTTLSHTPALAGWTLGQAVEYTLANVWEGTRSYKTCEINGRDLVRHLGASTPVANIGRAEIDGYIMRLRERGNSHGTMNRKYG